MATAGKAFPFQDAAVREWRVRLEHSYGPVTKYGVWARKEMVGRYREITDDRLRNIRDRYGISHALLYSETPTAFPEIYSSDVYKIIRFDDEKREDPVRRRY